MYVRKIIAIASLSLSITCNLLYANIYQIAVSYNHDIDYGIKSLRKINGMTYKNTNDSNVLTLQTSKDFQKSLDDYANKNRLISAEKFKKIYGASLQEFRAARLIAQENDNIEYAFPVNAKQSFYVNTSSNYNYKLNNDSKSQNTPYHRENVTQWNRYWDDLSTSNNNGIDLSGAWRYLSSHNLYPVNIADIDSGFAPYAPWDIRHVLDAANSRAFYFDQTANEIKVNTNYIDYEGGSSGYHGTHTAGTIAADGPNITGITANFGFANLYAIKAIYSGQGGYSIPAAELWSVNQLNNPVVLKTFPYLSNVEQNAKPAKVLNESYGTSRFDPVTGLPSMTLDAWINSVFIPSCQIKKQTNDLINAAGAVEVIAAGNDAHGLINDSASGCPNIHAIVVESTNREGQLSYFSTHYDDAAKAEYSKYKDVLQNELGAVYPQSIIIRAPGGDTSLGESGGIYSSVNCPSLSGSDTATPNQNLDCYAYMQGTSMATPHVSGIIALIYALRPNANYTYISGILNKSKNLTTGVISARKVVENAINTPVPENSSSNDNNNWATAGIIGGSAVAALVSFVLYEAISGTNGEANDSITGS